MIKYIYIAGGLGCVTGPLVAGSCAAVSHMLKDRRWGVDWGLSYLWPRLLAPFNGSKFGSPIISV